MYHQITQAAIQSTESAHAAIKDPDLIVSLSVFLWDYYTHSSCQQETVLQTLNWKPSELVLKTYSERSFSGPHFMCGVSYQLWTWPVKGIPCSSLHSIPWITATIKFYLYNRLSTGHAIAIVIMWHNFSLLIHSCSVLTWIHNQYSKVA